MSQTAQKLSLFDDEPGLFEIAPAPQATPKVVKQAAVAQAAMVTAPVNPVRPKIEKAATAHRTISEVAEELDVPQHVLRFWETKFSQLRPLKRAGGRRYYRTEDVALIQRIHSLLYAQGYTIKGAQKVLKEKGAAPVDKPVETMAKSAVAVPVAQEDPFKELRAMLAELKDLRALV